MIEVRRAEHEAASTPGPKPVELRGPSRFRLGYALIQLGDTARGRAVLREALESRRSRARPPTKRGLVRNAEASAALGHEKEAYRYLESALEKGFFCELDSPLLESLRGSRRFEQLRSRAVENQRAMQRRFRELDIHLVPDGSVAASSGKGGDEEAANAWTPQLLPMISGPSRLFLPTGPLHEWARTSYVRGVQSSTSDMLRKLRV